MNLKREMYGMLLKEFKGWYADNERREQMADMTAAIYWYAMDYHTGQSSELYAIMSNSKFRPGPFSTLDGEGDAVKAMYECLENAGF